MEPVSIAAACMGLISSIFTVTKHVQLFACEVRDARKDMDGVNRELSSMSLCLELLQTDCSTRRVEYPETFQKNLSLILNNTDIVTQQIKNLLQKLQSNKLGRRIQWMLSSREEITKLQSTLEKQRSCIDIALSVGSIQILSTLKKDMERHGGQAASADIAAIRLDTSKIRENVDVLPQIVDEIRALQKDVFNIAQLAHGGSSHIQDFLQESFKQVKSLTNEFASELAVAGNCRSEASRLPDDAGSSMDNPIRVAGETTRLEDETIALTVPLEVAVCSRCGQEISPAPTPMTTAESVTSPPPNSVTALQQLPIRDLSAISSSSIPREALRSKPADLTPLQQEHLNRRLRLLLKRRTGRGGNCSHKDNACTHIRELQEVLDQGADINTTVQGSNQTPLILELRHKDVRPEIVRFLLEAGASIEDLYGVLSPIIMSPTALGGQAVKITCLLIEFGLNIQDASLLKSIITSPAEQETINAITGLLLEHGADPDSSFPLYDAVSKKNQGAVERLLDAGAEADGDRRDRQQRNPLRGALKQAAWARLLQQSHDFAVCFGIARVLLERGANVRLAMCNHNLPNFMHSKELWGSKHQSAFSCSVSDIEKLLRDHGAK